MIRVDFNNFNNIFNSSPKRLNPIGCAGTLTWLPLCSLSLFKIRHRQGYPLTLNILARKLLYTTCFCERQSDLVFGVYFAVRSSGWAGAPQWCCKVDDVWQAGGRANVRLVAATRKWTHITRCLFFETYTLKVNLLSGGSQVWIPSLKRPRGAMWSWVPIWSCMLCAS